MGVKDVAEPSSMGTREVTLPRLKMPGPAQAMAESGQGQAFTHRQRPTWNTWEALGTVLNSFQELPLVCSH